MREGVRRVDYRNLDGQHERPSTADYVSAWPQTRIVALAPPDPALTDLEDAFRTTHVNGGARLARFRIEAAPDVASFLGRNRFAETGFFSDFFGAPNVAAALPEAGDIRSRDPALGFEMDAPFVTLGRLGHMLVAGGAYRKFGGSDRELFDLLRRFSDVAFGGRSAGVYTWVSYKPWSKWFFDIAWDASFFWFKPDDGVVTVLLVTDTD